VSSLISKTCGTTTTSSSYQSFCSLFSGWRTCHKKILPCQTC